LGGDDVQEDRPRDNFGIDRAPRVRERGTRMRNRTLACKNWHSALSPGSMVLRGTAVSDLLTPNAAAIMIG